MGSTSDCVRDEQLLKEQYGANRKFLLDAAQYMRASNPAVSTSVSSGPQIPCSYRSRDRLVTGISFVLKIIAVVLMIFILAKYAAGQDARAYYYGLKAVLVTALVITAYRYRDLLALFARFASEFLSLADKVIIVMSVAIFLLHQEVGVLRAGIVTGQAGGLRTTEPSFVALVTLSLLILFLLFVTTWRNADEAFMGTPNKGQQAAYAMAQVLDAQVVRAMVRGDDSCATKLPETVKRHI